MTDVADDLRREIRDLVQDAAEHGVPEVVRRGLRELAALEDDDDLEAAAACYMVAGYKLNRRARDLLDDEDAGDDDPIPPPPGPAGARWN